MKGSNHDIAWKYVAHLVEERGSTNPEDHEELALLLVRSILRRIPKADLR